MLKWFFINHLGFFTGCPLNLFCCHPERRRGKQKMVAVSILNAPKNQF